MQLRKLHLQPEIHWPQSRWPDRSFLKAESGWNPNGPRGQHQDSNCQCWHEDYVTVIYHDDKGHPPKTIQKLNIHLKSTIKISKMTIFPSEMEAHGHLLPWFPPSKLGSRIAHVASCGAGPSWLSWLEPRWQRSRSCRSCRDPTRRWTWSFGRAFGKTRGENGGWVRGCWVVYC